MKSSSDGPGSQGARSDPDLFKAEVPLFYFTLFDLILFWVRACGFRCQEGISLVLKVHSFVN